MRENALRLDYVSLLEKGGDHVGRETGPFGGGLFGRPGDDLPRTWLSRIGNSTRRLAVVDEPEQLGDSAAYFRGAATLHALRREVGDEPFARILGRYAQEFRHSVATTEDFVAVAEAETRRDLSDFFDAWLYQEAVPATPGG